MFFVTAVKDYIELLNNIYDSVSGNITIQAVLYQTLLFIGGSLKDFFWYLISFNWLRDIVYLPVLVPQISISLLKENGFENTLINSINDITLTFSTTTTNNFVTSKFLVGFLNSLFLCLPISCSHLISLRRLIIQGFLAGVFSNLGIILGQWWFLTCVIFGLRWFVLPWFSFESFNLISAFVLTFYIILDIVRERAIRIVPSSDKINLLKFFLQTFFLSWVEQICIFQYLNHLTLGSEPSVFEIVSETTSKGLWFGQSTYLLGLLLGSLFFSVLFNWILLSLRDLALVQFNMFYGRWVRGFNRFAIVAGWAATFMVIPFHGADYLLTRPLGFISQDRALTNSIFSSRPPKDFATLLGKNSNFKAIDTDIIPFDRARYARGGGKQTFEDLNFEGERAWISKRDNRFQFLRRREGHGPIRRALNRFFGVKNFERDNKEDIKIFSAFLKQRIHTIDTQEKIRLGLAKKGVSPTISESLNTKSPLKNQEKAKNLLKNQEGFSNFEDQEKAKNPFPKRVKSTNYDKKLHSFLKILGKSKMKFRQKRGNAVKKKASVLFKKYYYSNLVYKLFLNCDIDLFLSRQPKSYLLSVEQEQQLVEKRNALATYYDSLRNYNQLTKLKFFQEFFQGSKSYADRVYNQQFKGTLFITRRLFAISLNSKQNPFQQRVLKYDQPLYKSFTTDSNPILHEELQEDNKTKLPFLELSKSKPFYSGWDESLRKFVITNRFFSRKLAAMALNVPPSNQRTNYSSLYSGVEEIQEMTLDKFDFYPIDKVIEFTAWPLSRENLIMAHNNKIPYPTLFQTTPASTEEEIEEIETSGDPETKEKLKHFTASSDTDKFKFKVLPRRIRNLKTKLVNGQVFLLRNRWLSPNRGGFVWPGKNHLQFDFIKLFRNK